MFESKDMSAKYIRVQNCDHKKRWKNNNFADNKLHQNCVVWEETNDDFTLATIQWCFFYVLNQPVLTF